MVNMLKCTLPLLCLLLITLHLTHATYPTFDNSYVLQLTDDTFESTVSDRPVFIQFYAPWCGHCKAMAPAWNEAATTWHQQYFRHAHPDAPDTPDAYSTGYAELHEHITRNTMLTPVVEPVLFAKIDCVANRFTCSRFAIRSYPKMRLMVPYADTLTSLRAQSAGAIDVSKIQKQVYSFEGARSVALFLAFIQNYKLTTAPQQYPYIKQLDTAAAEQPAVDAAAGKPNVLDRFVNRVSQSSQSTLDRIGAATSDPESQRFTIVVIALFVISSAGLIGFVVFAVLQHYKISKTGKDT